MILYLALIIVANVCLAYGLLVYIQRRAELLSFLKRRRSHEVSETDDDLDVHPSSTTPAAPLDPALIAQLMAAPTPVGEAAHSTPA